MAREGARRLDVDLLPLGDAISLLRSLTLGEIEQGIARVRGRGDRHQASALERWLRDVETGFEDRVLPVTLPVAAAWGRQQYAQPLPVIDALIAATARVHGMTVVTRNVKDFELAGVQVLNPFAE